MNLKVFLHTRNERAETSALLDCGATENFIHLDYARRRKLPVKTLERPRKVINVDGTPNAKGEIQHYVDLELKQGDLKRTLRFFLTDIGDRDIILGYPWFAAIQPNIDWARGWIATEQLPVILKTIDAGRARFVPRQRNVPRQSPDYAMHMAFVMFPDRTTKSKQTLASQLAEQHHKVEKPILPAEYRRHSHVFSERESHRFPNPRLWDHAIELKKDAPSTLPGKVYSLTQQEQKTLEEFLVDHLKRGYIRPSKSPYASPFFFIKKKDGKLRPVQDYRKVNEWTIRNRYPLPLIPELINRVKNASLFSKFDIRWGYNNVRIKQGDEWKAAFITNKGLFEPRVMFFGLTNSPATFQTMMNAIFAEELLEGWLTVYMDDLLIHTPDNIVDHRQRVHRVLDKLRKHDLFLKPEKCLFEKRSMEFLGVVLGNGTIQMDPTKLKGVADWPTPRTVKDVRGFLGFTGFYRYFVPHYSQIARPLIDLTRKATTFHWDKEQVKAFEHLKTLMCSRPILRQPDYTKQFFLATDASAYGVGAVLLQEGEINPRTKKPTQHPIAYYSATFIQTERNYDIYERELLAVIKALQHWRPHLAATEIPVIVLTDHANLTFWKNPKTVNRRVARWFAFLQDYNLQIKHVPGKLHAAADMLSRPPTADRGENDNTNLTLLPPHIFVRLAEGSLQNHTEWSALEDDIRATQAKHGVLMKQWNRLHSAQNDRSDGTGLWLMDGSKIIIPPDDSLKKVILRRYHDAPTAGHPGRDRTIARIEKTFWWPSLRQWVEGYVKGCATCQQNKIRTHPTKPLPYRIPTNPDTLPFQTIAMDLITHLPVSKGNDAILTIVDHGCTRAAIFLPCKTTITGEGVASLYLEHVYRWFGLPSKMISDRDPRFTSHFAKALCQRLGVHQNVSTAFHPQTDGLSERKNQWVEMFLRHLTSTQQDDWADWLPIATASHNHFENATTRVAPSEAMFGYLPRLDYQTPPSMNDRAEERTEMAYQKRLQAREAINKWAGVQPSSLFKTGDRVWLEGKHLNLPYQTLKLAPKRHGPFLITKVISPVAYRLELPPAWTIHDVFHAGLLTPYRETPEYGVNFPRPPPDIVDGEKEFEVEAISRHRLFGRRHRLQYLIKWKGYPSADNTWEDKDQVFADDLIKQYHKRYPLEVKRKSSSRRVAINFSHIAQWPLTPPLLPSQPAVFPRHPSPFLHVSNSPTSALRMENSPPAPCPPAQPITSSWVQPGIPQSSTGSSSHSRLPTEPSGNWEPRTAPAMTISGRSPTWRPPMRPRFSDTPRSRPTFETASPTSPLPVTPPPPDMPTRWTRPRGISPKAIEHIIASPIALMALRRIMDGYQTSSSTTTTGSPPKSPSSVAFQGRPVWLGPSEIQRNPSTSTSSMLKPRSLPTPSPTHSHTGSSPFSNAKTQSSPPWLWR
jgi:hypothetical protein